MLKKGPPPDFWDPPPPKKMNWQYFFRLFSFIKDLILAIKNHEPISLIRLIVYFQPAAGGLPDIEANDKFGYQWCIQPDPWWDHDWALVY